MINVTKPFLPPEDEYLTYVNGIFKRNWLTNNGPLVNELELKLKQYLGIDHLLYLGNGTIAIQIAIKALGLKGEIITTPFSYVATTSSLVWEGCKPVFVDIDPKSFNLDPLKIEAAITADTSAILMTHVYGNPCDVEKVERIASKHKLKVIYDAAHAFGTTYKGRSIYEYGDVSTASFHATKLFHTIEGGAVMTRSTELTKIMAYMRNFGHNGPEKFSMVGVNGKNSEFHAAMGLCNLKYIDEILRNRKQQYLYYLEKLSWKGIQFQEILEGAGYNYSYFPAVFESEELLLKVKAELELNKISPRRYFYPNLSTLPYVEPVHLPVADSIAPRVLCLPVYYDMTKEEQDLIVRIILRNLNHQ